MGSRSRRRPRPPAASAHRRETSASSFREGPSAQSGRNRQLFLLNFQFGNNESITPGGPFSADALLGGGESDIFPARELIVAPNQQIMCSVAQVTTGLLTVHVLYHCLVYRFAT